MPGQGRSRGSALLGSQTPTHHLVPKCSYTLADDVFDMADLVGVELFPWQRQCITDILGVGPDGKWAASEAFIEIARQNGKSVVLDMIALTALYIWRLPLIVYSAHETQTALDAFERLEAYIRASPALLAETPERAFRRGNGKEAIRLSCSNSCTHDGPRRGHRVLFRTRTAGGGRGLSGDLVILDEAQELKDHHTAALKPTLRARPNPLSIYAGSAGDLKSTELGRLVRRMGEGDRDPKVAKREPRLCGWRFAADEDDDPADPRTWAKVTPLLGRLIQVETMAEEQRGMSKEKFARELLCIGDYPREDGEDWVIPASDWKHTIIDSPERWSTWFGKGVLALDAKPDQSWAAIGVAGQAGLSLLRPGQADRKIIASPAGGIHIEVLAHERGIRWVPARVRDLLDQSHLDLLNEVVIDPKGPLARIVPELEELGIKVHLMTAQDVVDACSWLVDSATNEPRKVWHRGAAVLTSALASASTRTLLGGFAWRRQGSADISPLCAANFAGHAAATWATKPATPPGLPRTYGRQRGPVDRSPRRRGPRAVTADLANANF